MGIMLESDNTLLSRPVLLGALVVIYVAYRISHALYTDARIRKLGSRAPIQPSYLPLNLDTAYDTIMYAIQDKIYEQWVGMFNKLCVPGGYTIEGGIGQRAILTADPENIKAILATQFKDYGKGRDFRNIWHPFLGDGIFTTDGELWHNSRQLLRPQFIRDRLSDIDIFEEHSQVLISTIGGGQEIDTLDMMYRYTLDAATHFLLGKSVHSLVHPQTAFADAFYEVQRIQSTVSRLGPVNWIVPRTYMGYYKALDTINNFVNTYIDQALALSPEDLKDKTSRDDGYTFLHAIAGYTRDRSMLRDQIMSVLLAGRDTTACTLTWTIYHLSVDARVTAKLRQEILDTVGLDRKPTYEDLKGMKYLQHILNESLRLYPIVPINVRVSLNDTTLPTGGGPDGQQPIGILKDTPIVYSPLVMQRRTDLYPSVQSGFPPIDKFVPERWDNWTPKPWIYVPFNGGPRICIGQQFALTEMAYTLVRLFQRYKTVENRMNGQEPGLHADIALLPAHPVKVVFR